MAWARSILAGERPGPMVELVSVDSMAVYRGMDIGTAKPTPAQRREFPIHLVDLVEPHEDFAVAEFQALGREAMASIVHRGHRPLLVGGTGLYLRALVDNLSFPGRFPEAARDLEARLDAAGEPGSPEELAELARLHDELVRRDPVAAERIDPANRRRLVRALEVVEGSGVPFSASGPGLERYPESDLLLVGLSVPIEVLHERIARRFATWMEDGLLDEVRRIRGQGGFSRTARQALGYRELLAHLDQGVALEDAVDEAVRRTRIFAKRQMSWFARDPRIVWIDGEMTLDEQIEALLGIVSSPRHTTGRG